MTQRGYFVVIKLTYALFSQEIFIQIIKLFSKPATSYGPLWLLYQMNQQKLEVIVTDNSVNYLHTF
jgi:hypothetical protein